MGIKSYTSLQTDKVLDLCSLQTDKVLDLWNAQEIWTRNRKHACRIYFLYKFLAAHRMQHNFVQLIQEFASKCDAGNV